MTRASIPALLAITALFLALAPAATAAADTVASTIPITSGASAIAVTPDGSKVVLLEFSNQLRVLDVASGTETAPTVITAAAYNLVMSPTGATALVPTTNGELYFVDLASGTVSSPFLLGSYLFDAAFSPDGTEAYLTAGSSSLIVIDVASRTVTRTIALPGHSVYGIDTSPDGLQVYLTDIVASTLFSVELATGVVGAGAAIPTFSTEVIVSPDGTRAYIGSLSSNALGVLMLASGTFFPLAVGGSGPVVGMALSPDGSLLYAPRAFGNEVTIIDTFSGFLMPPLATGVDSRGIVFTADGTTAFVGDTTTPAVLVIAVDRPPLLAAAAPAAGVSAPYSFRPTTQGSPAPVLSISAGALPPGLTLDSAAGVISGTPTQAGVFTFTVTATNALGTATRAYSLTVAATLAATGVEVSPVLAVGVAALLGGILLAQLRRRPLH